jgi:hypothetical protein
MTKVLRTHIWILYCKCKARDLHDVITAPESINIMGRNQGKF